MANQTAVGCTLRERFLRLLRRLGGSRSDVYYAPAAVHPATWMPPTHYGKPDVAPGVHPSEGLVVPPSAVRDAREVSPIVTTEAVEHYYDMVTDQYVQGLGDVFQGARPESTDALLEYLAAAAGLGIGQRVLDAGCGVCGPAIWFASRRGVSVEALSISAVQVAEAERRLADAGIGERVTVRQGDFHRLADLYAPATFDRVLFLESLCHAEDYRRALAGAMTVLKPGGYVYIKDYYSVDHRARPHMLADQITDLEAMNRVYRLAVPDLPSMVDLVSGLGFRIEYIRHPLFERTRGPMDRLEKIIGEGSASRTSLWPQQPIECLLLKYPE